MQRSLQTAEVCPPQSGLGSDSRATIIIEAIILSLLEHFCSGTGSSGSVELHRLKGGLVGQDRWALPTALRGRARCHCHTRGARFGPGRFESKESVRCSY